MKDLKGKIAIALVCAVLGLIISIQFKTVKNETDGGFISGQRAQQLSLELQNLRTEKERLSLELTELERRQKEYEQTEADENFIIRNLKNDLEKYQILSGNRAVEGPGVVITLEDIPQEYQGDFSFIMLRFDIMLDVINKLNSAGAEAISINDQRYTATTEIFYNANAVYVNSVPLKQPFQIQAIGDPEIMEAALNMRFGTIYTVKQDYGDRLKITMKKQNNIVIPRYNRVTNFRYARPVEANAN
ncbi:DUF881 domain-containing protein [Alkaliphilus transvaalensis]|uniref:DUF881 domain-containing protein n=1 Tax=Alkaliphilus transvaalensis TaxID=114628 RepID=UPI00047AA4CB|nr:DUF881 domain-containing protein [Alkaliphilus transvaalensis]